MTQLADLVSSARAILGAAPNMKRVKLSLTLDRDGAIAVDAIAFTGVSGNS